MNASEKQEWSQPWTSRNAILIHMLPLLLYVHVFTCHTTLSPQPDSSYKHSKANLPNFEVSLVRIGLIISLEKILFNRFLISAFPITNLYHGLCNSQVWKNSSAHCICADSKWRQIPPSFISAGFIPKISYPTVSPPTAPLQTAVTMHVCTCSTQPFSI